MSKPESGKTFEVKCVVVGNTGTGKTYILQRLAFDTYIDNPEPTVSAANFVETIQYGNTTLKMEVWDTVGREKYMALHKIFYKGSKIVIFTYDITNKKSFDSIESLWLPTSGKGMRR